MVYQVEELSLELTNSCPLACRHCSSGSSPKRLPDELTFEDHIRLLYEARELGATVLSLSGGTPLNYDPCWSRDNDERGEPGVALMMLVGLAADIGFEKILLYITGHSIYGSWIFNHPKTRQLLDMEQLTWIFSIHSHIVKTNDYIMNRDGALVEIISSIQSLIQEGERVEIHMVPMAPNYSDISGVRELCANLGIKRMSLLRFVPQTRGKVNFDRLGMSKAEFVEMQLIIHKELLKNSHSVDMRAGCPIDFRHALGLVREKQKPCHAGDDLILVRPQGEVHPCAAWKSLPAASNVLDVNGNPVPLRDIWESSVVFRDIRRFKQDLPFLQDRHNSGTGMMGGACGACTLLMSCLTGCPAQRLHAMDANSVLDLHKPTSDPLCYVPGESKNGCKIR